MTQQWYNLSERGNPFAVRLILWIALHLGRRAARAVLPPITLYFFLFAKPQRLASRHYLGRVLKHPPSLRDIARHIHCFASTILDRVFLLAGKSDCLDVRIHNAELILDRVAQKQGCILLGSHLGSFEVLRVLAVAHHKLPLKILMYPDHNQQITQIFSALNPEVADTVIPMGRMETLLEVDEYLSQGYIIGMLGDRVAGDERSTSCKFMGEQISFPEGPMLIASTLKAPVLLFFGLYRGGNRYDIHFELLSDKVAVERKNRASAKQQHTQHYASRLEHYARMAPYNWFNFYDFWNDQDKPAHTAANQNPTA